MERHPKDQQAKRQIITIIVIISPLDLVDGSLLYYPHRRGRRLVSGTVGTHKFAGYCVGRFWEGTICAGVSYSGIGHGEKGRGWKVRSEGKQKWKKGELVREIARVEWEFLSSLGGSWYLQGFSQLFFSFPLSWRRIQQITRGDKMSGRTSCNEQWETWISKEGGQRASSIWWVYCFYFVCPSQTERAQTILFSRAYSSCLGS